MPASPSSSFEPPPSSAAPRRAPFYATAALSRQSVHSLPSIQHLQHGFAKLGLLAEADAEADKGAPGVGRTGDRRRSRPRGSTALGGSTTSVDEHDEQRESDRAKVLQALGPEPERPVVDDRPAWQRAEEAAEKETAVRDVAQLRSNAIDALDAVCTSRPPAHNLRGAEDRGGERGEEEGEEEEERLWGEVRRRAWDVLGMVRELEREMEDGNEESEERHRVREEWQGRGREGDQQVESVDSPFADEQRSSTSSSRSPTGPADNTSDDSRRSQVAAAPSAVQTALVQRWADAAAAVLRRSGGSGARRGRVSDASAGGEESAERVGEGAGGGREEGAEEEEGLPAWAREEGWDDGLARAHAIICAVLPASQIADLPDPTSSRDALLDALSDGVLLSHAFNAVLRLPSLSRPFGFLPPASIHTFASPPTPAGSADMVRALSTASNSSDAGGAGGERVGVTFRRAENLAQWAAALKHRYALSLGPPAFDARLVAARRPLSDTVNEGAPSDWRKMLGGAVGAWAGAAASEAREVWDEERECGTGAGGGHTPGVEG
ncbi:hypothetical protein Rhopal_000584-T1 [Rhodotorula paludigena]|uniref:Calponin-homology (CH) domain-containing protein n=1 Tax=Rhodotorula paludigena TaxID=86838 RepID=A0AAV5GCQ5_9BASI|nr:hypothetical protein Rhopal_000584-T1 [Rhodotorula paludigena]